MANTRQESRGAELKANAYDGCYTLRVIHFRRDPYSVTRDDQYSVTATNWHKIVENIRANHGIEL